LLPVIGVPGYTPDSTAAATATALHSAGGWTDPWDQQIGYQKVETLLQRDAEVQAIVCGNDTMAVGAVAAVQQAGKTGDILVVGFDGLALGEYSFPPLTTVRQDFKRHGHEMVDLVLEQAASGPLDGSRSIIIPTELLVRGSTAPPAP